MMKIIIAAIFSVLGAFTAVGVFGIAHAHVAGAAQPDANEAAIFSPRTDLEQRASYAPVVEKAAPAVVNIYTKRVVTRRMRSVFDDPFFRDFFGGTPGSRSRQRVESSLGSGVIVDAGGIIVTNNHVVENAGAIKVVLADRREFEAEVILTDPQTDLAVLRIDADGSLPHLSFSDSDGAAVGDIVLAIGNPFGVGQTVTSGIVSALSRTAASISDFQFFIQTDAAINPGNSGGALVDVDGNLLGVNTAIYSRSGGSNGIGFAIPGNLVRQVVASAVGGQDVVRRPWLGLQGTKVDAAMATAVGLDRPMGVIVGDVFPKGPGAKAGIKEGDVVLDIGGQRIFDAEALRYRVATRPSGERVAVRLLRDGETRSVNVRLDYPPEVPARNETTLEGQHVFNGVTVANLSPALAEELGRNPMGKGVVILRTEPGSLASRNRLMQPNFVVRDINGREIKRVEDMEQALKDMARSQSRFFVMSVADPNGRVTTLRSNR